MRQWSAGLVRTPEKAKTGTARRTKHLPVVNHTVCNQGNVNVCNNLLLDNSTDENETSESDRLIAIEKSKSHNRQSRFVYNYEDKYRFSRVITDSDLIFDSHFESGNLLSAQRISSGDSREKNRNFQEYDLELHHDLHSINHTQWFYFSCSNIQQDLDVKFNLTNFVKNDSLFNHGMKPLMFSKRLSSKGVGWRRVGKHICYYVNGKKRGKKHFHTLTFTHKFEYTGDCCYFAFSYPYTYTDLQNKLFQIQKDPTRCDCFRRRTLCKTLSGNNCDILTITEPTNDWRCLQNRQGVVITARVHPGETNASWVCDGVINFLTGPTVEARILRSRFVFKVVPMLNPDGVINGNYRTSMAGVDLNRRWDAPDRVCHPTIHSTKEMVQRLKRCRQILTVCDLHGHSRKEGAFMYGCATDDIIIKTCDEAHQSKTFSALTLPQILNKRCEFFKLESCNFKTVNCNAPTMRTVMAQEIGIDCSYSLEASLGGINGGHFTREDFMTLGEHFCRSILELSEFTSISCVSSTVKASSRQVIMKRDSLNHRNILKNTDKDGCLNAFFLKNKKGKHATRILCGMYDLKSIDADLDPSDESNTEKERWKALYHNKGKLDLGEGTKKYFSQRVLQSSLGSHDLMFNSKKRQVPKNKSYSQFKSSTRRVSQLPPVRKAIPTRKTLSLMICPNNDNRKENMNNRRLLSKS